MMNIMYYIIDQNINSLKLSNKNFDTLINDYSATLLFNYYIIKQEGSLNAYTFILVTPINLYN
jgi:hypothetical protein